MIEPKLNEHDHELVRIDGINRKFGIILDTFGCPENYDRLLKNGLRLAGMAGVYWYFQANSLLLLPMFILAIVAAGLTELRFFQNNPRAFEFTAWR